MNFAGEIMHPESVTARRTRTGGITRIYKSTSWLRAMLAFIALFFGTSSLTLAGTGCVNPGGTGGCFASISAAVAAASSNDTIQVAAGTYHEDVVVPMPLSIVGAGAGQSIVDAAGLSNGFDIDGHHHPNLSHVLVTGFTVENANFQGILITDSSYVTIRDNHVTGNDRSLNVGPPPTCPGLPAYFVAGEGFDCGEGIHLSGVTHSTIEGNLVEHNAGGILISDDTGLTSDNLISGNVVRENPYDCAITLASHHFQLGFNPAFGVFHNTVAGNTITRNGLATNEGAGVGIFAGPPGGQNYGNVVIGNVMEGNGLPGVTMHSHSPFQNLNNNLIVGNRISNNGPDADVPTAGPTGIVVFSDIAGGAPPITGTLISQNIISNEAIGIAVATNGSVDAHLNSLLDKHDTGLANLRGGTVDARENWWGCKDGPTDAKCAQIEGPDVLFDPWLTKPLHADKPGAKK
jgi:parallel beta-helix repeat protein